MDDLVFMLWVKAVLLFIGMTICGPHELRWGECVDTKTEMSVNAEWVHCDWEWEPVLRFDPLRLEWEEVETGYTDYHMGPPLTYWVRLQSGDRSEWIEVQDWEYSQAVIGEMFSR